MQLKPVSKKAIKNMLIPAAVFAVLLDIAAVIIWFAFILGNAAGLTVKLLFWVGIALVNAILFIAPFIRYRRYRYLIDETRIVKQEGIFFVSTEIAPIERVHQISIDRGPIDTITGLAKVTATTAGGEITIRFLEKEHAEQLALSLERTVKNIVKEQARDNEE